MVVAHSPCAASVCILAPVRHAFLILVLLVALTYAVGSSLPGCEDVLDVCQPCGDIDLGDVRISGDPRIDGTFDAVQRIRQRANEIDAAYDTGLAELIRVFNFTDKDEPTLEVLKTKVAEQFSETSAARLVVDWTPPDCFVDWHLAAAAQHACEKRLCNFRTANEAAWCRGYLTGTCASAEQGACFNETATDSCDGRCIGACRDMVLEACPGLCAGTCEGDCAVYNDAGQCNGRCSGSCSGMCESPTPYHCGGTCNGRCEAAEVDAGCAEPSLFQGSCEATAMPGQCRGHLFPAGCDDNCQDCDKEAADCREMAKAVAWSAMTCDGTGPSVRLDLPSDTPNSDGLLLQARTLERVLKTTALHHAWLSLIVDGNDVAGAVNPAILALDSDLTTLDNPSAQYFDGTNLPVDLTRGQLPLENLKARVAWLKETALTTEGTYVITAGAFPCVEPALNAALEILQQAVPVREIPTSGNKSVSYKADRTCAASLPDGPPCLYKLLDDLAAMLALAPVMK